MSTLSQILTAAGFSGAGLATAEGVATAESGANATAHNGNAGTGDNSYGLFQINMLGSMGPARLAQYGLSSNDALFDPLTNAKVAYQMSNGGTNWGPWTTFTSGLYRAFYGVDKTITNGDATSSTTAGGSSTTPVIGNPLNIPGDVLTSALGAVVNPIAKTFGAGAVKVLTVGVAVAGGVALVVLGINKAAGNPARKAAKASVEVAPVAATAALL